MTLPVKAAPSTKPGPANGTVIVMGPVTYVQSKGQWLAKLDVVDVGMVSKLYTDDRPMGAFWRCYLPGLSEQPRPVRDEAEGRERLTRVIMDWIDAAKLAPADPGTVVSFEGAR